MNKCLRRQEGTVGDGRGTHSTIRGNSQEDDMTGAEESMEVSRIGEIVAQTATLTGTSLKPFN